MCGIYAYKGQKNVWKELVLGLEKLEYRGYDSAGLAIMQPDGPTRVIKSVGKVSELSSKVMNLLKNDDSTYYCGIAHTRRATHGGVTEHNAHPHFDNSNMFFVVHNGIIENYQELRASLIADGVHFYSDTDTEIIPNLLSKYRNGNFLETVEKVLPKLHGAFALLIMSSYVPGQMIGVKVGSPLVFGNRGDEFYFSSDIQALGGKVDDLYILEDGELIFLDNKEFVIKSEGEKIYKQPSLIEEFGAEVEKGDYPHWMLKEIYEQPQVIANAMLGRINLDTGDMVASSLTYLDQFEFRKVCFIACGSSSFVGLYGRNVIENISGLGASYEIASEFEYRNIVIRKDTLYVFLSQSGETADTIDCVKKIKNGGGIAFGIVNVVGSTISRLTDCGMFVRAGAEVGVASTKALIGQMTVVLLLAMYFAKRQGRDQQIRPVLRELKGLSGTMTDHIEYTHQAIVPIAEYLSRYNDCFFLGKHYQLPAALESSLKLKEISYIHSEAYSMAELKHGPLSLLSEKFPVVAFCPQDEFFDKNVSNILEAHARKAPIITIGDKILSQSKFHIGVPHSIDCIYPFYTIVVGQLLAYEVAKKLGRDIDKPRNLAKSVTVK